MQWKRYPVESNKTRIFCQFGTHDFIHTRSRTHIAQTIHFLFYFSFLNVPPSLDYISAHGFVMAVAYNVDIHATYSSSRLVYCLCGCTAHILYQKTLGLLEYATWLRVNVMQRSMNRDVNSKEVAVGIDRAKEEVKERENGWWHWRRHTYTYMHTEW